MMMSIILKTLIGLVESMMRSAGECRIVIHCCTVTVAGHYQAVVPVIRCTQEVESYGVGAAVSEL